MATVTKWIVFVGDTFSGHEHDYTMLKTEFPPEHPWFETIHALLDLGYKGILDDYVRNQIEIPHKKPRKSKKNPEPKLSSEQKSENQALSRVRIFVIARSTWKIMSSHFLLAYGIYSCSNLIREQP